MKTNKASKALFVQRLMLLLKDEKMSMRAFAAQIGISHASLSRIFSGEIAVSPATVALVCGKLGDRERSGALIEAYLLDQLQEITRTLAKKHEWARGRVVTIEIVPDAP